MSNGCIIIPNEIRIKNALINIPIDYGIDPNSKVLEFLKDKLNKENLEDEIYDPISSFNHYLWENYQINKPGYLKESFRVAFLIAEYKSPNRLMVKSYGSKSFKIPSGIVDLNDWNNAKAHKCVNTVSEEDASIFAGIREIQEETSIDVTKIPDFLNRIKVNKMYEKNSWKVFKLSLILTHNEYNKHVIKKLENINEDIIRTIDPEIKEIRYKFVQV